MTVKVTISGPKGSGKTTLARAIKSYLLDLGYHVAIKDEPGEGHQALAKTEVMRLAEMNLSFARHEIEVYSNQEEAEVLSNKELTQRVRALEARR